MSQIFHHFDAPTCEGLMKKVAARAAGSGRAHAAIQEFVYDAELKETRSRRSSRRSRC